MASLLVRSHRDGRVSRHRRATSPTALGDDDVPLLSGGQLPAHPRREGTPRAAGRRLHAAARHLGTDRSRATCPRAPERSCCSTSWSAPAGACARRRANAAAREAGQSRGDRHLAVLAGGRAAGHRAVPRSARSRAAMTSGVDLLNGLAVLTGIDRLDIPGVTDGPDNDYAMQACRRPRGASATTTSWSSTSRRPTRRATPATSRARSPASRRSTARSSRAARDYGAGCGSCACPTIRRPIDLQTHVGEPVPFVLAGPGIGHNGAIAFDEAAAAATGLVLDPGRRVMDLLLAP